MEAGELTVTVELKRRPLWSVVVHAPALWRRHYREMRRANGVIVSAYGAWLLASSVLVFVKRKGSL